MEKTHLILDKKQNKTKLRYIYKIIIKHLQAKKQRKRAYEKVILRPLDNIKHEGAVEFQSLGRM